MSFNTRIPQFICLCIILIGLGGGVHVAYAQSADFVLTPSSGNFSVGDTLSVEVQTDSSAQVNSAQGVLSFDQSRLKVSSIDQSGSAFNLWVPSDPTYSNTDGTVTFSGGSTAPLSGGINEIITVVFEATGEGDASLSFNSGSILSGPGTDITGELGQASYSIGGSAPEPPPPSVPDDPEPSRPTSPSGPTPPAPLVESDVFEDPDAWYATTTATFSWELAYNVEAVRLLYDDDETSIPTVLHEPAIASRTLENLEEGETYFHVMFRNSSGWGIPTHKRLRIDLTPPNEFTVSASQLDPQSQDVTLRFDATDELSGIAKYDVAVDGELVNTIEVSELSGGAYTLFVDQPGDHVFTITAYDRAGNAVASETTFNVQAAVEKTPPPAATTEDTELEEEGINWSYWVTLALVAGVAFLIGAIMYERRANQTQRERILEEANEAREKIEGVFSVLRDEVEERVISLATKPNMTESERQILEKLKEALEISEELLDKEIEDVRKMLQ